MEVTHSGGLTWALLHEAALGRGTAGSLKGGLVPYCLGVARETLLMRYASCVEDIICFVGWKAAI